MSKTYCSCVGMRGEATRRGGNDGCRVSCQSYDGSVIVYNWYDIDGKLKIRVGVSDSSKGYEDRVLFTGSIEDFEKLFKK